MASTIRQPFRLTSSITVAAKGAFRSAPARAFHQGRSANNFFSSRTQLTSPIRSLVKPQNVFRQSTRSYIQPSTSAPEPQGASLLQKLAVGGAMFGGTWLLIQAVFNRETRDDGGMPAFERSYLNDTFLHTGLGVGIIGVAARAMYQSGVAYRIMAANPWVVMIGGLALSFGTMIGTRATDPSK